MAGHRQGSVARRNLCPHPADPAIAPNDPDDIEFFLAHAPIHTPAPELISIAGLRWTIEEDNEHGKTCSA
jgi:hypothetical protein